MAAATVTAVTAPQMIRCCKDHPAAFKIKIAGHYFRGHRTGIFGAVKAHDTLATEAGLIPQLRRHPGEQRLGNLHAGTPAGAFVSGDGAKLAVIRLPAQRAERRIR